MVARQHTQSPGSGLAVEPGGDPYARLKDAVLSGELAPGQPLVETTVASWFRVSRTPIREAFTRLEQDGLLSRDPSGVLSVRERTRGEILDIYETRIPLERAAARSAAERRTTDDLLEMQRSVRQWDVVDRSDERAMMAKNRDFHRAVWRASHNESLIDVLTRLDLHVSRFPATTLASPGRWDTAGEEHARIVAAIERRDADVAGDLATAHFEAARTLRLRLWSES